MDNMKAGWDRPQEDEFGLCMMGQPSPYLMVAFPNRPPIDQDAFSFKGWSRRKIEAWKRAFLGYLKALTFKDPRRLVLKSPTHSCRIRTLLELFPDARFIHIVRNPYAVYPSTVNLWRILAETHGLQTPTGQGVEEYVYRTFTMLYDKLEEDRRLVPPEHFHELKYEDLVREPMAELRKIYEQLNLGDFDAVAPQMEAHIGSQKDYKTNRHELEGELRSEIPLRAAAARHIAQAGSGSGNRHPVRPRRGAEVVLVHLRQNPAQGTSWRN